MNNDKTSASGRDLPEGGEAEGDEEDIGAGGPVDNNFAGEPEETPDPKQPSVTNWDEEDLNPVDPITGSQVWMEQCGCMDIILDNGGVEDADNLKGEIKAEQEGNVYNVSGDIDNAEEQDYDEGQEEVDDAIKAAVAASLETAKEDLCQPEPDQAQSVRLPDIDYQTNAQQTFQPINQFLWSNI